MATELGWLLTDKDREAYRGWQQYDAGWRACERGDTAAFSMSNHPKWLNGWDESCESREYGRRGAAMGDGRAE